MDYGINREAQIRRYLAKNEYRYAHEAETSEDYRVQFSYGAADVKTTTDLIRNSIFPDGQYCGDNALQEIYNGVREEIVNLRDKRCDEEYRDTNLTTEEVDCRRTSVWWLGDVINDFDHAVRENCPKWVYEFADSMYDIMESVREGNFNGGGDEPIDPDSKEYIFNALNDLCEHFGVVMTCNEC